MRVAQDTVVSIEYTLKDDQGNILDASDGRGPLEYLQGFRTSSRASSRASRLAAPPSSRTRSPWGRMRLS